MAPDAETKGQSEAPSDGLIEKLTRRITWSENDGEAEDEASWRYEKGVLLTRADARLALAALLASRPTEASAAERYEFVGFTDAEKVFADVREVIYDADLIADLENEDIRRVIQTVTDALLADPTALRAARVEAGREEEKPTAERFLRECVGIMDTVEQDFDGEPDAPAGVEAEKYAMLYWDKDDPEYSAHDLDELADMVRDRFDDPRLFILPVERAECLPDAWVAVRTDPNDEDRDLVTEHATEEEAEAVLAASRPATAPEAE